MKNRVKLALFAGGVLAILGSFVPLTTYADGEDVSGGTTGSGSVGKSVKITAEVNPTITIDPAVSGKDIVMNVDAGDVLREPGIISVKVTANTKYTIGFRTYTETTAMVGKEAGNSDTIPALTDGLNIERGTNAWAMKGPIDNYTSFYGIKYNEVTSLYQSEGTDDGTNEHKFQFHLSTSRDITADSYSVQLVVVASPS